MKTVFCLLVFGCFFSHNASSQGSRITCPKPLYKEGESTLSLTVNTSTFSLCDLKPTSATCLWSSETGTDISICLPDVTSCDLNQTSGTCPCVDKDGDIYNYNLAFSKPAGQNRGSISCSLDCTVFTPGAPEATIQTDKTCQNITFGSKCDEYEINKKCNKGKCQIDKDNRATCDCTGTDKEGPFCNEPKPSVLYPSVALAIVGLALIVVLAVFTCYQGQTKVLMVSGQKTEDTKNDLRDKLKEEACCSCSSVSVDFLYDSPNNRTAVILESRNCYSLRNAYNQTKAFIQKMTTPRPGPDGFSPRS